MQITVLDKNTCSVYLQEFIEIIRDNLNEYWTEEHFMSDLPGKWQLSRIVKVDETLAGFIIASRKNENQVHVHKFAVSRKLRSNGIGKKLFEAFREQLEPSSFITLKVYKENLDAIRFYENLQFAPDDESPESELLLTLKYRI